MSTILYVDTFRTVPLEIIEIQSGSYLGEDDIVRLLDIYGRQCE
jgi:mannose-6-phosphate isomerase-like protein (cupin superfamily)